MAVSLSFQRYMEMLGRENRDYFIPRLHSVPC